MGSVQSSSFKQPDRLENQKFLITRKSVERRIKEIKQILLTSHDASNQDTTRPDKINQSNRLGTALFSIHAIMAHGFESLGAAQLLVVLLHLGLHSRPSP